MKVKTALFFIIFFQLIALFNAKPIKANVGDWCCLTNDPGIREFVSFDPSQQTCTYKNPSTGTTSTEIFQCAGGTRDANYACEQITTGTFSNIGRYICVDATPSQPTLPDAGGATVCCDYTTGVQYDSLSRKCVRYVKDQTGSLNPVSSTNTKCPSGAACVTKGLISDGRPFHVCVASSEDTIECPGATDPLVERCINTALGPIRTDAPGFIKQLLSVAIGIGSGIAFLMILKGSYEMVISQGNPEGLAHAKDTITNAIIGIVFVILSVTILQIIGVDLLGLNAYGF